MRYRTLAINLRFNLIVIILFLSADCNSYGKFWATPQKISGSVVNLLGSGLVIRLNNQESLPIYTNGDFNFSTNVNNGDPYSITVSSQPTAPAQPCTVSNGSGTMGTTDFTGIKIDCMTYLMGGTLQGRALNIQRTVTTFAGTGGGGAFLDATGTAAQFNGPLETVTPDGRNLYVADSANCRIRKIVIATGVVTTLAGNGTCGSIDGTGTGAQIKTPFGLTTDGTNLYVSESGGSNKIRKIVIATAQVTTFAGSGSAGAADLVGTAATFNGNNGLTTDNKFLYVADQSNNKIRKVDLATAQVTTLAGGASGGGNCGATCIDATGTAAQFNTPTSLTTDGTNLYVFDYNNNRIRKIVIATGAVTSIAGDGTTGYADGIGTAAKINVPGRGTTDGFFLYVAQQTGDSRVRKIDLSTLVVTTIAGSGAGTSVNGSNGSAEFNQPNGMTSDGTYIYVGEYGGNFIRLIQ